ncbi:MAG TPA: hypothetical protein VNM41_08705, partial [Solirubrobacterales bacterium]|nr:hypothetical protein [Solirubrobacterales bacterium]
MAGRDVNRVKDGREHVHTQAACPIGTVPAPMRRFASWTTSHRKTVILAWIAALIVTGMIAKTAGDAFSEDFSLPASDSKEALDLLEQKFPAQSGEAAQIVFQADQGVDTAPVKKT